MGVRIVTDSACDLPAGIREEYDIEVVPLLVYLHEQEYLDGMSITSAEMYASMREGKVYTTAQVPPGVFAEMFTKIANQGDSCIYLGFSSELSGTYASAVMAKEQLLEEIPELDLEVLDTRCASMGFGLVVYKAAQMAREGRTKNEILHAAEHNAKHMEHIFTVDDLEYLCRGGRVSRTSAVMGGILNIKPVLHVEDGKLIPLEKVRGRGKAIRRMVELMGERGNQLDRQTIGISHGDDLAAAQKLMELIKQEYGSHEFLVNDVGCSIGAHSGPGTLSVFFLNDQK